MRKPKLNYDRFKPGLRCMLEASCWGETYLLRCRLGDELIEVGIRGPTFTRALGDFISGLRQEGWSTFTRAEPDGLVVELLPAEEDRCTG